MKTDSAPKVPASPGLFVLMLFPNVFWLLFYSLRLSVVLGAFLFTALVFSSPASFRSRGGSFVPAIGLVTFLWLSAAVTFVLSFFGAH